MSVMIKNLTNRLVLLRLNSGRTLHLSPRITSKEIMDVEVNKNTMAQKLQGRHVIALHEGKKGSQIPKGLKKGKAEEIKEVKEVKEAKEVRETKK